MKAYVLRIDEKHIREYSISRGVLHGGKVSGYGER